MPFVMPEIIVRKVIDYGIKQLRANKPAFDDLFSQFLQDELNSEYGEAYREEIWTWFSTTKIPVVQAWSFNAQKIPSISIHLANESEDESKAAMNDYAGTFDDEAETGTGVFTVMIDVGIHTNKAGNQVLWLYYIISYILFKYKPMAERLGLKLHTYSASDYSKRAEFMGNNIWTRWVRFKCTTQNFWDATPLNEADAVNFDHAIGLEPASDISTSLDVDIETIDPTANEGLRASSSGDPEDDDTVLI